MHAHTIYAYDVLCGYANAFWYNPLSASLERPVGRQKHPARKLLYFTKIGRLCYCKDEFILRIFTLFLTRRANYCVECCIMET